MLKRRKGSPIEARTLDIAAGGMRITADRPLAADELLHFDLALPSGPIGGEARVLREAGYKIYALRFETPADAGRAVVGSTSATGRTTGM